MNTNDAGIYETMTTNAARMTDRVQYGLDSHLYKANCDEVAMLFFSEEALECYVGWAKEHGIEHFNSVARDTMRVIDWANGFDRLPHLNGCGIDDCHFDVRFEFLQIPKAPWRIEAMCILDGCAPLHVQSRSRGTAGMPFHVSYKMPGPPEYHTKRWELEEDMGLLYDAEYQNSYGRFTYYRYAGMYLKPRVNLRDADNPAA